MTDIQTLIQKFATDIVSAVKREALAEFIAKFNGQLPGAPKAPPAAPKKRRRKATAQLCPVPACANRAAPIFGMVCASHKKVPKAKIKAYRAARRARKGK